MFSERWGAPDKDQPAGRRTVIAAVERAFAAINLDELVAATAAKALPRIIAEVVSDRVTKASRKALLSKAFNVHI